MKTDKRRKIWQVLLTALFLFAASLILTSSSQEVHAATTGFVKIGGKTYYRLENGTYQKGWLTLNGKKYYFNSSTGAMVTGWAGSGAKRRFFSKTDGHMFTGWVAIASGKKRYFKKGSGYMSTGWVAASNGSRRYFDPITGYMFTGWLTENNVKYYLSPSTGFACRGWVSSKAGTRYFNTSTGAMYTGLQRVNGYYYYFYKANGYVYKEGWGTVDGKKYYFDKSTGRAQTGWLTLNGKTYYFNSKGVMYANTKVKISGQYYTFDSAGVAKDVPYVLSGNNVKVYSAGKSYLLVKEFVTHPGIANGKVTDEELLAALIDCEASTQGKIGMEACALAILNRTISPSREFPANLRYVIYQGVNYPQYSPVRNGALLRRLNGFYWSKTEAQQAAKEALKIFNNYVTKGTKRTLKGFATKDFNYMYFMAPSSFWSQNLNFSKVQYCTYTANGESHVFFVDWISG